MYFVPPGVKKISYGVLFFILRILGSIASFRTQKYNSKCGAAGGPKTLIPDEHARLLGLLKMVLRVYIVGKTV